MKDSQRQFGSRFKGWRQSKGLSAYRIAKTLGYNVSYISNIEAGRRPMSDDFARRVAEIPGMEISFSTLQSWKILQEYEFDAIKEAYEQGKES